MEEPTKLEKVSGSLPSNLAMAGIAAFDGGVLSSFLPVLTSSLAAGRHEKRTKEWMTQIVTLLEDNKNKIDQLSDEQYKLINHAAIAALSTTENIKLDYLKNVIRKSLENNNIRSLEAEVIGRWIRDISADEISFIIRNFSFERVEINKEPTNEKYLSVSEESFDASIVAGLVSLGILLPSGPNIDTLGTYSYSNLVAKLVALVTYET